MLDALLATDPTSLQPPVAALTTHADLSRSRRRLHEKYLQELRKSVDIPQSELPYLFSPTIGPDELETLSHKNYSAGWIASTQLFPSINAKIVSFLFDRKSYLPS